MRTHPVRACLIALALAVAPGSFIGCDAARQAAGVDNWKPYLGAGSGITEYSIGRDHIKVRFRSSPKVYVYREDRLGKPAIDMMKQLAERGQGLNTFINRNRAVHYGAEVE